MSPLGEGWREEAAAGALAILPLLLSSMPIALLFGALAASAGLGPGAAALMSGAVFAGGAQFVALQLWAQPAPVLALAAATAAVNLRHVLMGASIAPDFAAWGVGRAYAGLFFLTDEGWALALRRRAQQGRVTLAFWLGMNLPFYGNWVAMTALGAAIGNRLGDPARWGLDFAFPAVFLVLLVGLWRGRPSLAPVAASAAAALAAHAWLPSPWYIVLGGIAGAVAGALRPGGWNDG